MSKSPWFTPKKENFVITVRGNSELELMSKVEEHEESGFELLKMFSDEIETGYYSHKTYFARMSRKTTKVV